MEINKEVIESIRERVERLRSHLDINTKQMKLDELKMRIQDPDLWSNPSEAESIMKKSGEIENFIKDFKNIDNEFAEIEIGFELGEPDNVLSDAGDKLSAHLDEMELYAILSNPEDNMECILKITAGAGGTEAQDWTNMLLRMYLLYCREKGFKTEISYIQNGADNIGLKTVSIKISGEYAYGFMKSENGIHRLVRVSPFNAQGKRMTSFASVFVTPLIDDTIKIELDKSKLSYEYFRCSGAGGQNVNKVNSGVRARYWYTDPDTGAEEEILVENTETRDQPVNKENATNILKSILYKKELDRQNRKKKEIEDSKGDNGWGNQIRSYVLDDARVKDHRTGYQDRNTEAVLNGHIDNFIKEYLIRQI